MSELRECEECRALYRPGEPEQRFCSRRCGRIAQARQGVPSWEDRKLKFMSAMLAKFDELFKPK